MLCRGVGDGQGKRLSLAVLQNAVRAGGGETRLGKVGARQFRIEGAGLEIGVGKISLTRAVAVEALIIPAQQGGEHLVDIEGVLDAEPHIEIAQQRIGGVEIEARGGLRGLVVEPQPLDIALLELRRFALVMPPVGHHQREGIELAAQEVLPGDVLIPDHLDLESFGIEAVLEVALVIAPPILDPFESDRLALFHLVDLVGAGDRQHLPVVLLDPIAGELDGMAWLRADGQ